MSNSQSKSAAQRFDAMAKQLPRGFMLTESGAPRGERRFYHLHCDGKLVKESARLGAMEKTVRALIPLYALERAERLFREALPQFNWSNSALSAEAIKLLNDVPRDVANAIAYLNGTGAK